MPERQAHPEHLEVAAGIVLRPQDGALLLTQRPPGKPWALWWEFPGGKIEPGESPAQALVRELHEEIGIHVNLDAATPPWMRTEYDYPGRPVRLHWYLVAHWRGALRMREGQQMAWQPLPPNVHPLLPAAAPVLARLAQERTNGANGN